MSSLRHSAPVLRCLRELITFDEQYFIVEVSKHSGSCQTTYTRANYNGTLTNSRHIRRFSCPHSAGRFGDHALIGVSTDTRCVHVHACDFSSRWMRSGHPMPLPSSRRGSMGAPRKDEGSWDVLVRPEKQLSLDRESGVTQPARDPARG